MDIQEVWEKALAKTEVIRPRVNKLHTFQATNLPYIFLAESFVNVGDTVVRKGDVVVEKPSIILPPNLPQFEGFDFEEEMHVDKNTLTNFLLVRGIIFPSLKYNNKTSKIDIYENKLNKAVKFYSDKLQKQENVDTGLVVGPEDCWQFSILIFICTQIAKSASNDIRKLLEEFRRNRDQRE